MIDSPTMVPAVTAVMVMVDTCGEEMVTLVAPGTVDVIVLAMPAHTVRAVVCGGDDGSSISN